MIWFYHVDNVLCNKVLFFVISVYVSACLVLHVLQDLHRFHKAFLSLQVWCFTTVMHPAATLLPLSRLKRLVRTSGLTLLPQSSYLLLITADMSSAMQAGSQTTLWGEDLRGQGTLLGNVWPFKHFMWINSRLFSAYICNQPKSFLQLQTNIRLDIVDWLVVFYVEKRAFSVEVSHSGGW